MKLINEIGNKYGRLTVKELVIGKNRCAIWRCVCECGKETFTTGTNLRNGTSKSCGCSRREIDRSQDLSGQRFGKLVVIKRVGKKFCKNGSAVAVWLCQCDCGNFTERITTHLKNKKEIKNCGCYVNGRLARGESAFNSLYKRLENSAKERGYSWELTKEDVKHTTSKNCFYCGKPPSQVAKARSFYGEYIYNGLDRVDNNVGYTKGNVVPCCGFCNYIKKDHGIETLKNWIVQVYNHWASK